LDELNCLKLETEADEDSFVNYSCQPDNRLMGAALGPKFKALKPKIVALTNDQLRAY